MKFYAQSHKGKVRSNNEDSFFIPRYGDGFFALVADGMGGHRAGETASGIIVETAKEMLIGLDAAKVLPDDIKAVFSAANKKIFNESRRRPSKHGMGTTASLAVFCANRAIIGHVGDSRVYHYGGKSLSQVTRDHSFVQSLVDRGIITKEEAFCHPQRNIITRAVGTDMNVQTDIYSVFLKENDALLLCTDGLCGIVPDIDINQILGDGLETAAPRLVQAALDGGGADNITVVIAAMNGGAI
ncbi:MAG: Stp1/IreP family PP2C-type Ser/Thr phosphatase [Christensenellales bacterium]